VANPHINLLRATSARCSLDIAGRSICCWWGCCRAGTCLIEDVRAWEDGVGEVAGAVDCVQVFADSVDAGFAAIDVLGVSIFNSRHSSLISSPGRCLRNIVSGG